MIPEIDIAIYKSKADAENENEVFYLTIGCKNGVFTVDSWGYNADGTYKYMSNQMVDGDKYSIIFEGEPDKTGLEPAFSESGRPFLREDGTQRTMAELEPCPCGGSCDCQPDVWGSSGLDACLNCDHSRLSHHYTAASGEGWYGSCRYADSCVEFVSRMGGR